MKVEARIYQRATLIRPCPTLAFALRGSATEALSLRYAMQCYAAFASPRESSSLLGGDVDVLKEGKREDRRAEVSRYVKGVKVR